jgi:tetratricopeptide (TPR) repeat protein
MTCRLLTEAVIPTLRAGRPAAAIATGRRAIALAAPASPEELSAAVALGTALVLGGELAEARDLVLHARELALRAAPPPPSDSRAYLGSALRLVGELGASRHELEQVIDVARTRGSVGVLAYALVRLADVELEAGDWKAAATQLREGATFARETGQAADRGLAVAGLAWLAAVQGREDDCRQYATQALEIADRLGVGSRLDRALPALGLLELGRGDHAAAATHLGEVRRAQRAHGWCDAAFQPHRTPDLVEALIGAGDAAAAADELAVFEDEASRTGRASAIAAAARCRGTLASDHELDGWFRIALEPGLEAVGPFELARTHLAYAERLTLAGRADDAAAHLSAARSTFDELGAEPWRLRAERTLG